MGELVNIHFSYKCLILANAFYIFAVEGELGTTYRKCKLLYASQYNIHEHMSIIIMLSN